MVRKSSFYMLVVILFFGILPQAIQAGNHTILQLEAHQKTVGENWTIDYSILYDVSSSTAVALGDISVRIPDNLTVEEKGSATWDKATGTLKWHLDSLIENPAGVLNFKLKPTEDVEQGEDLMVNAEASFGAETIITLEEIVEVGPEQHQPFFTGYPDETFRPDKNISRAEIAAVISRIKNLTDDRALEEPYQDVSSDHWAYEYIMEVTNKGYMEGYQSNFRPDEPVTKAEFVTLILRMRGIESISMEELQISDTHWAINELNTAHALGFTDEFREPVSPDGYVPRDRSAKFLNLAFYRGELVDGEIEVVQHYPDVNELHWAFHWIEEASEVAHTSIRDGMNERLQEYNPSDTEPF